MALGLERELVLGGRLLALEADEQLLVQLLESQPLTALFFCFLLREGQLLPEHGLLRLLERQLLLERADLLLELLRVLPLLLQLQA